MSDPLEAVLRDTFGDRASRLDPNAAVRLLAVDYRPRRRRLPVVAVLGATSIVGAVAALVMLVALGSGVTPAFAGWVPAPTQATSRQIAEAVQACGLGTPVLTDTRGPYTATVYSAPNGIATCIHGGSLSFSANAGGIGAGGIAPGQIQTFVSGSRDASGHVFTVLDGRAGAGVSAVRIRRSDGSEVTATVSGGWYLAWWPGTAPATAAQITTLSGVSTTALSDVGAQAASSCGQAQNCATAGSAPASSVTGVTSADKRRRATAAGTARSTRKH